MERAESLGRSALEIFESRGDHWSKSIVCIELLALVAIVDRQFEEAKDWMRAGLRAAEEIGYKYSIQTAYWQLGFVAVLEDNYAEAGQYWRRALGIADGNLGSATFIGFGGSSGRE
ncbi:MAG: hypothetical protein IPK19_16470 [Chloroflexi bacterium]|nr:hypothetical protein [Chloroflexota bacterium]